MAVDNRSLEELLDELSPRNREEVRGFAEFLLEKRQKRTRRKPRFDWGGALRELREQYTSVELQHKISRLRVEDT